MSENACLKEKYQALSYGNVQFDKSVLYIASGALGVSFGFIEKIIPSLADAANKTYLIVSWYCFAGVIFLSLVAHFISMMAIRWAIVNDDADAFIYNKISRNWNYLIRILNIVMITGLLLGIILLIKFVNINL
jgi:hypothetical protein